MHRSRLLLVGVVWGLGACASAPDTGAGARVGSAAAAPLTDLNLVKDKIPEVLLEAQLAPYKRPANASCADLLAALKPLDEALGPDLDSPSLRNEQGLVAKGGEVLGDAAVDAVKRTAEGLLPFRGWLRKLSGAERYSREVAAAVMAGRARRAFLKGVAAGQLCPVPPNSPTGAASAVGAN